MQFKLPELGYNFNALEPAMGAKTVEIHYTKHHAGYLNNLNNFLKDLSQFDKMSTTDLMKNLDNVPSKILASFKNNLGGYANHNIFWRGLATGTTLSGTFKIALENAFGSIENFKTELAQAAATKFGSGWAWLVLTQQNELKIVTTTNQDSPLMGDKYANASGYPIIGIDVWEHAYYLDYQNRRAEYLENYFSILNWDEAARRFETKAE